LGRVADTSFYYQKLRKNDGEKGVFFLFENLEAVDNSGKEEESFGEFIRVELKERQHNISKLTNFKKYRFVPATQYPTDSLSNGVLYSIYKDPLELSKNETFMDTWITLSRVLFNSELTEGILYYRKWQGNLASGGGTLRIKK
jgi:hypothetical protein